MKNMQIILILIILNIAAQRCRTELPDGCRSDTQHGPKRIKSDANLKKDLDSLVGTCP